MLGVDCEVIRQTKILHLMSVTTDDRGTLRGDIEDGQPRENDKESIIWKGEGVPWISLLRHAISRHGRFFCLYSQVESEALHLTHFALSEPRYLGDQSMPAAIRNRTAHSHISLHTDRNPNIFH